MPKDQGLEDPDGVDDASESPQFPRPKVKLRYVPELSFLAWTLVSFRQGRIVQREGQIRLH